LEKRAEILALLVVIAMSAELFPPRCLAFRTLRVGADSSIHAIHEAIRQAEPGDTVLIEPGTYPEGEIIIDKALRLIGVPGRAKPVVDAGGKGNVFEIRTSNVEISGLRIQNSGYSYIEDLAGIKAEKSDNVRITGNELVGNFFGIHIGESQGTLIENNRIVGPDRKENASANGIHAWHCGHVLIRGNDVSRHRDGIYFEFVSDSAIVSNSSHQNLRYGLHFMYSNGNEYEGNVFRGNASGVAVMYSRRVRMTGNWFGESWGGAAYGILLKEITLSDISKNHFVMNSVGAYLEGTTRSSFHENSFESNGWALRVLGDSDGNRFIHNNFLGNTFDVSTNSSTNQNLFSENFWSDYSGVDLNRDGFGDLPYRPVRLSSVLMERFGVSVVLLKSFFFSVADDAERMFPVLTPDALRDEQPLMRKRAI
jgi:nitrous oxidase accessory protein